MTDFTTHQIESIAMAARAASTEGRAFLNVSQLLRTFADINRSAVAATQDRETTLAELAAPASPRATMYERAKNDLLSLFVGDETLYGRDLVKATGWCASTTYNRLSRLVAEGVLERTGRDRYRRKMRQQAS